MKSILWMWGFVLAFVAGGAGWAQQGQTGEGPNDSAVWRQLRQQLFKERPIHTATAQVLTLQAPDRAQDAAVVPVSVQAPPAPSSERFVKTLYLVVDQNPAPVVAVIRFGPASASASLDTRLRIDSYTPVRAIAELANGELHMSTRFVKASGGCSAPPAATAQQSIPLGSSTLRVLGEPQRGQPARAQLAIHHPNHTGLVMDQLTRLFTPAHFVRQVQVRYGDQMVFDAELNFAFSENPSLRFQFLPQVPGRLSATITDTQDRRFASQVAVAMP